MLKQRKSFSIIPLIIILFLIFIISPQKSVKFKNGFITFFKKPLLYCYQGYLNLFNISKIFFYYRDYKEIKNEIEIYKFKLNQLEEVKLENERLRKILELKQQGDYNFVAAQIIGKEPTNWLNSLIINKGSDDGVKINQPVMNFSGLIGKIIELTPNAAKVLLISDINSRVVVLLQRTREEGILEGVGKGLCRLKYLPVEADVELGDIVVSSGIGGVYPKSFIIGKIESIRIERGGLYKNCIVKPASPLSGLEEVLCLKSDSEL